MRYHLLAIFILLFLSFFFSCSETSIFSLSKIRARRLRMDKRHNSDILEALLANPTEVIITILIGNMFANLFASGLAASYTIDRWGQSSVGISIAVMTTVIVVFCEIMPKIIAIKNAEAISLIVSPVIRLLMKAVFPLRSLLSRLAEALIRFAETRTKRPEGHITKDELESAITLGYSRIGILGKKEAEMMRGILRLSDKKAQDVMTKAGDIVSFSVTMPVDDMCYAIKEAELSRIPVYEKDCLDIIGILYAKDLLRARLGPAEKLRLNSILREPFYVSQDMRLSDLLAEFRSRKIHMALVKDKKGAFIGLVTLEDLLEEIIGDIADKEALVQRIRSKFVCQPQAGQG